MAGLGRIMANRSRLGRCIISCLALLRTALTPGSHLRLPGHLHYSREGIKGGKMLARPEPVARDYAPGAVKAEVFVGATRGSRTQRWRWDVTFHRVAKMDRAQPGLLGVNGRTHIGGECGYALTRASAWRKAARAFHGFPEAVI